MLRRWAKFSKIYLIFVSMYWRRDFTAISSPRTQNTTTSLTLSAPRKLEKCFPLSIKWTQGTFDQISLKRFLIAGRSSNATTWNKPYLVCRLLLEKKKTISALYLAYK